MKMYNAIMNLVWDLLSMKCLKDTHLEALCGEGDIWYVSKAWKTDY